MLDDFLIRAALAGLGVALAAAPLGCFVVWRRMAYFGEATAHSAILGVALSLSLSLPMLPAILVVAMVMASAVTLLTGRGYAMDTVLGVMAHSALAAGLVAVALLGDVRLDLTSFLFGDILAVGKTDLAVIWGGAALVLVLPNLPSPDGVSCVCTCTSPLPDPALTWRHGPGCEPEGL